jgi:WD40 repeat protein
VAGDSAGAAQYTADTLKRVRALVPTRPAYAVAFSADGQSVAATDGYAKTVYSLTTGESSETPGPAAPPEGQSPVGLAWSPDGRLARILNDPPQQGKWAVRFEGSRAGLRDLRAHDAPVTAIAWSGDGARVATGGADGALAIWDGKTLKELQRAKLGAGAGAMIHALAFAPDGKTLAAAVEEPGGKDPVRVALIEAATGKEVTRLVRSWVVPVVALAWSKDGKTLVSACGLRTGDERTLTAEQKRSGGEVVVWERKP